MLASINAFSAVRPEALAFLAKRCRWRNFARGETIVRHGAVDRDVYFVVRGRVRVSVRSPERRGVSFRDLAEGELFGELAAIDGEPRSASVVALSDGRLAALPPALFWEVVREHPEVAEAVLRRLARTVRELVGRVVEFSTLGVQNRVHAELLRLAREYGVRNGAATIEPAPVHAELAERVSTNREAVARELGRLARLGVVERRRGALVIRDLARLERMVADVLGR